MTFAYQTGTCHDLCFLLIISHGSIFGHNSISDSCMDTGNPQSPPKQTLEIAVQSAEPSSNDIGGRRYPAIFHAAIVSAVVLPVAFLPYVIARRQIAGLRQRMAILEQDIRGLQGNLETSAVEHASVRAELGRLRSATVESAKDWQNLSKEYHQSEASHHVSQEAVHKDILKLRDEARQHSR